MIPASPLSPLKFRSVMLMATASLLFFNAFISNPSLFAQPEGFQYKLHSVLDADAEKYIVSKTNIRTFHERFKPHHSYWAAATNGIPATLTFRFPLENQIKSAQFYTNMIVTNFNNDMSIGKGIGHGSLWCSRDGKTWLLLIDAVPPDTRAIKTYDYHTFLPAEIFGSKELWIQVRLLASDMKDSTYSVAQFARKDYSDPNSAVFELRVKYASPARDQVSRKTNGISK